MGEMMKRRVNGNLDNIFENMTDLCQIRELEPLSTTKLLLFVSSARTLWFDLECKNAQMFVTTSNLAPLKLNLVHSKGTDNLSIE